MFVYKDLSYLMKYQINFLGIFIFVSFLIPSHLFIRAENFPDKNEGFGSELSESGEDILPYIVFDNFNSEVPYRIPAIACNRKGDLIAVSDYRYSHADIGMVENGKLDLRYRIKDGTTGKWNEIKTLAYAKETEDGLVSFGDPCIVADRESDRVLLTSCCGNVSFPKGSHENHQGWARFYSEDGGFTWSDYEDISNQIYQQLDLREDGPIRCFFIGSGKITQSRIIKNGDYYRLYCAALVKINNGKNVNYVFFSDDFGLNWKLLGDVNDCPVPNGGDEPKTEELPDGSVIISSRTSGGRYFNIFNYEDIGKGIGNWNVMSLSDRKVNGITASANACNGEILIIPVKRMSDGVEVNLLLQSVPFGPDGRTNVGINYKVLESYDDYKTPESIAKDWDGKYEITHLSSAYSTMLVDNDDNIAFLYEEDYKDDGYNLVYIKLSIPEITDKQFVPFNKK